VLSSDTKKPPEVLQMASSQPVCSIGGFFCLQNHELFRLNESALWALKMLIARATDCGCYQPEHYLVPFVVAPHTYDPTKPQASYYRSFNAILAASGLDFRPYDFRHTAITRLLENPEVSLEIARQIAGHISEHMIRRYFHGRLSAQR